MHLRLVFDDGFDFRVELRAEETPTIQALLASLPFTSKVMRWGDEIYFEAPFHTMLEEDARAEMHVGDVAYWPDGSALAVFFGRTPVSTSDEPKAYSRCNILGTIRADPPMLRAVRQGATVEVKPG